MLKSSPQFDTIQNMNAQVLLVVDQLKKYNPDKIILFGSHLYGRPTRDSDVDLILIKKTKEPFLKRQKRVQMLLRTTTPVDAFVFTPEEFEKAKEDSRFVKEIAERGQVIYG